MALGSGKRRSEIHAWQHKNIRHQSDWSKVSLFPSPSFLSKNQLAKEGPESVAPVVIPALAPTLDRSLKSDRSLCPVRALRYHLDRTSDIRQGKELVFVSFKKGFDKDISPTTISSWIKQTVILCYELPDHHAHILHQVKAHDVRAFAASKAFQSGVSLEQILSACHWKSHNTFTQFYLKDVAWADSELYHLGPVVVTGVPVHLPPFRISHSPPGIYNDCKGSEANSPLEGTQTLPIPGRLADQVLVSGGRPSEHSGSGRPNPVLGVDNKSGKIRSKANSGVFIHGLRIPSRFNPCKTHSREMAQISGVDPTTQVKICFDCKMFDVANWVACLNGENGPGGTPSHEALSVSSQGALEISSVAGQRPSLGRNHFCTPRLVAKSHNRDERCRPSSPRPQHPTLYKRLKQRLGCSSVTIPALTTIVDGQFKEDRTLCPVQAPRYYLDQTKDLDPSFSSPSRKDTPQTSDLLLFLLG